MIRITVDGERCKGCGLCLEFCPRNNLRLAEGLNARGVHVAEESGAGTCTGCKLCALMCPDVAITIYQELAEAVSDDELAGGATSR